MPGRVGFETSTAPHPPSRNWLQIRHHQGKSRANGHRRFTGVFATGSDRLACPQSRRAQSLSLSTPKPSPRPPSQLVQEQHRKHIRGARSQHPNHTSAATPPNSRGFELAIELTWQYDPPMTRTSHDTERRKPTAAAQIKPAEVHLPPSAPRPLRKHGNLLTKTQTGSIRLSAPSNSSRSGLRNSRNPKPICFVQLFQEPATKGRSFAAKPTRRTRIAHGTQEQDQSSSPELLTKTETRTQ